MTTILKTEGLTNPEQESTDPGYLSWRDAKVSDALEKSRQSPELRIPQAEIWKHFGLES